MDRFRTTLILIFYFTLTQKKKMLLNSMKLNIKKNIFFLMPQNFLFNIVFNSKSRETHCQGTTRKKQQ